MLKTLNGLTVAALFAMTGATASAQDADVGTAPNFIPLQDHLSMTEGEEVYIYWCWNCHGEGPGKPGTTALGARYGDSVPAVLAERTDLNPMMIEFFVRNGTSIMPHFRKTQISDAQLEALIGYLVETEE